MVQGQDRQKALEQALLEERAAKASLDLQVRALCAELTRASYTTGALGRSRVRQLAGSWHLVAGCAWSAWQATLAFATLHTMEMVDGS